MIFEACARTCLCRRSSKKLLRPKDVRLEPFSYWRVTKQLGRVGPLLVCVSTGSSIIGAPVKTSGTSALVVLADEAPNIHQAPIAPDHPAALTSPEPSPSSETSALETFTSDLDEYIQRDSGGTSHLAGLPPTVTSASVQITGTESNPRRRRRSPSTHSEDSPLSPELYTSFASEQRRGTGNDPQHGDLRPERERPPVPKRRRLMNKAMRLDPDSTSSNGQQYHAHGSPPTNLKNGVSISTNGHSSPTNGHSSPHRNGFSTSTARSKSSGFYGHDREEVTRLLIQGLGDLGYHGSANRLSQESGYEVESPAVAAFRSAILQGQWPEAEALLFGVESEADGGGVSISNGYPHHFEGLRLAVDADPDNMRFSIREQKYLELLEKKETTTAIMVLRHELQPLRQDISRLDHLSSLMVCPAVEDMMRQSHWDGALGNSRQILLQELSRSISPSVMIPDHRLAVLLDQIKQSQIAKCLYHNPSTSPSLFTDHMCDRTQFPLQTAFELDQNSGEIYVVEFSHNGKRLAASDANGMTVIYDTSTFQVRHTMREHTRPIVHISWSPDDTRLITCSLDNKAKIWDTSTGMRLLQIDHHNQPVSTACWAPDGEAFVTGSLDKQSQLCLWTLDGRLLYSWAIDYRIQDCAISPDGQRMVTISPEKQIFVYNYVTREEEYSILLKTKMTCISISRDSRYMLVNMADNEVQLIDIETAEIVRRFLGQKQHEFVIRSTFGGADENLIISGSEDSKVYIWHKENGTLIETLEGHTTGCVNAVSWNSADPSMFASAGDDKVVRIWSKQAAPSLSRRKSSAHSSHRGSRYL